MQWGHMGKDWTAINSCEEVLSERQSCKVASCLINRGISDHVPLVTVPLGGTLPYNSLLISIIF